MHTRKTALFTLLMVACSDGEQAPSTRPAVRVEVRPSSLLLAEPGATQRIEVVALDAEGRETVAPSVTFSASSPAVSVRPDGTVERVATEPGSVQILVDGAGVSATVFALLAKPAPGAKLVTDAQVLSSVEHVEGVAFRYRVRLDGTYAEDDLVVASESAPISGRVVSVEGDRVELELVAPHVLFEALRIDETFDLSRADVILPPDADYTFRRVGDRLALAETGAGQGLRPAQLSAAAPPPCEVTGAGMLQFSNFVPDFDTSLSLDLEYDDDTVQRMVLMGDMKAKIDATVSIAGAVEAKFECKKQLGVIPVPVTGPLQPFFGVLIPIGLGVGAAVKAGGTVVGGKMTATPTVSVELGFVCSPGASCEAVNDGAAGGGAPKFEPLLPSGVQAEVGLSAFGYADLQLGNLLTSARFGGVKAGPLQTWNVRSEDDQIDDLTYSSTYDLKLSLVADVGLTLEAGPLMITFAKLERKIELPIARSPKGTLTTALEDSETVRGRVAIDPTTLEYLGLPNVDSVTFYRYVGGQLETLATVDAASPTQSTFEATWPFQIETDAGGEVFHAFIHTPLLPLFGLEAPRPVPNPCDANPEAVVARTQAQLDALSGVKVSGSLTIRDGVTSLFPLSQLRTVCGSLRIQSAPGLASLAGLEALRTVQARIELLDTPIASLAPLAGATQSTGLWIQLDTLTSLAGLENLAVSSVVTVDAPNVQSLAPLAKIGPELDILDLDVGVDDLDELPHLDFVRQLHAGGGLSDLSKLLVIDAVEILWVEAPNAIDFDALADLNGLTVLALATDTEVVSLPPLPALHTLNVSDGPQIVSAVNGPTDFLTVGSATVDTLVFAGLQSTRQVGVVNTQLLTILNLTGLESAPDGLGALHNEVLEEVAASTLQTAGYVNIRENPALTVVRLGGLDSVTGGENGDGVTVTYNEALTTIDLGDLTTVEGDVIIRYNASLTDIDLTSLQTVQGSIDIRQNPMLDIEAVRKMLEDVEADSVVVIQ